MMTKNNVWMSLSDLMTGLMVIFLFIAIAYISRVNKDTVVLSDYVDARQKLHDKLVHEFSKDTTRWEMSIGKDLSLRFTNPTVLFQLGSWELTPDFCRILDEFLPRYFGILLADSLRKNISEIRIEGHTDPLSFPALDSDPYIANVILSQRRSVSVLRYLRSMPFFNKCTYRQRQLIEYWLTANGLSYGRTLDSDGDLTFHSGNAVDNVKSRRVEFRVVTTSDEVIENFLKQLR